MFDSRDSSVLKTLLATLSPLRLLIAFALLLSGSAFAIAQDESDLLSNVRKLTFEGRRAGEGYFSADGTRMVFQSERDPSNPFYQIYVSDLETGDIQRVSPGFGKTTCGWIHPNGEKVLFASTHADEKSKKLQQEELDFRASGKSRRYSWDYDPNYELYAAELDQIESGTTKGLTALTNAMGYDAEASYSPDGKQIVFASNRAAYSRELTEREREQFERDPAFMIDLYIMDADGSNVKRLTGEPGYDGGPFFSPDGRRICWRRFAPNGATAEIFTMKTDGSDVQRLTEINAMSWAPFYHPSGEFL
ncbi:MAG: peptidase M28, partial [Rhodopirellula sp.]|nr:peptidase M28 [Rhodopirellula sp.]